MSQGLPEPGVVPAAPLLTPPSAHCPVHQPGKRQRSSTSKLLFLTPHPPWDAKGVSLADETTLFRKKCSACNFGGVLVAEVSQCQTGGKPFARYWFLIADCDKYGECSNAEQKVVAELPPSRVLCMPSLTSVSCDQCHWMQLSNKMPKCQYFIKICFRE